MGFWLFRFIILKMSITCRIGIIFPSLEQNKKARGYSQNEIVIFRYFATLRRCKADGNGVVVSLVFEVGIEVKGHASSLAGEYPRLIRPRRLPIEGNRQMRSS